MSTFDVHMTIVNNTQRVKVRQMRKPGNNVIGEVVVFEAGVGGTCVFTDVPVTDRVEVSDKDGVIVG